MEKTADKAVVVPHYTQRVYIVSRDGQMHHVSDRLLEDSNAFFNIMRRRLFVYYRDDEKDKVLALKDVKNEWKIPNQEVKSLIEGFVFPVIDKICRESGYTVRFLDRKDDVASTGADTTKLGDKGFLAKSTISGCYAERSYRVSVNNESVAVYDKRRDDGSGSFNFKYAGHMVRFFYLEDEESGALKFTSIKPPSGIPKSEIKHGIETFVFPVIQYVLRESGRVALAGRHNNFSQLGIDISLLLRRSGQTG